jgi:hypothetical protein
MRIHPLPALALAGVLAPLAACDLDVPDLNDPSLGDLQNHPDAISIGAACTGLLIGNRANKATEGGFVSQLGIVGRESYNFDAADPRYIGELLSGTLQRGSPFGGAFWAAEYANIQLGTVILGALPKVSDLSTTDKAAISGFVKTINALDLLEVVVTHDTDGAVLDVNPDPLGQLAPIVTDTTAQYAKITGLLDGAVTDLTTAGAGGDSGGSGFPFGLGKGFTNFDSLDTFLKFNRALRARVAAYTGDYAMVLAALHDSFLNDDRTKLNIDDGVYYAYSTKPGDTANALINPTFYAPPALSLDVEQDANGNPIDDRLLRKTVVTDSPGGARITDKLVKRPDGTLPPVRWFRNGGIYSGPEASVPLIRNEELILLEAEAKWFTNDQAGAITAIDTVRVVSGKLGELTTAPTSAHDFVKALLYEREFSLLFEGGHRWVDVRRFQAQLQAQFPAERNLPIFTAVAKDGTKTDDMVNLRYPVPLSECNARPTSEPACQ